MKKTYLLLLLFAPVILAEPTYRWGVVSSKDSYITEKLWSAGLNVTLFYKLQE